MSFAEDYAKTQKNIARLMVRRYLRSWIGTDPDEDLLISLFVHAMRMHPDFTMRQIAQSVDTRLTSMWTVLQQQGIVALDEKPSSAVRFQRQFDDYLDQETEKHEREETQ